MALALLAAPIWPACAQLLGPVERTVGGLTNAVRETANGIEDNLTSPVRDMVRTRLQNLLRANPQALEADDRGFPVVRGEIFVLSPNEEVLARAKAAGFAIVRQEALDGLDVTIVTLRAPQGMSARQALKRLKAIDPQGQYDLNHIYTAAGKVVAGSEGNGAPASGGVARVGLVDTGVADHPALNGLIVEQRGFAPGGVTPAAHGTAVASLLVGRMRGFAGAAPGLPLLVADIYGNGPTGGSAEALARALGWMAMRQVAVVNVSLVGPPNLLVRTAVTALEKRGHLIVAAVGNDGPAAPPLYPASYPGVIAVTGVDARNRILIEAGRGSHVDFAAPGSDMMAAGLKQSWTRVRGTSFAAPLVAGRLALVVRQPGEGAGAVEMLAKSAIDLGKKGPDPIYGQGLVCAECRKIIK